MNVLVIVQGPQSQESVLKIGEVAAAARVSIVTVRFYERRGVLPEPDRRPSGYRDAARTWRCRAGVRIANRDGPLELISCRGDVDVVGCDGTASSHLRCASATTTRHPTMSCPPLWAGSSMRCSPQWAWKSQIRRNRPVTIAQLRGCAASAGVHEGRARIVESDSDFERIEDGDVLVATMTTPAYNVVVPLLGAVVTDTGGVLCHAAIVAREFAIRAVVGAGTATTDIPDVAHIRVDGNEGTVTLL